MANSDKNILITPNTNQSDQPKIEFVGSGSNAITLKVLDDNSLSWEGSEGQLFSITPVLSTGSIFSVNDISGIPSIEVDADGTVSLAEFSGNVGVGTASPTHKLTVNGTVSGSTGLFTTITASAIQGAIVGNADTATKLATARTISATGDITWSVSFDGSGNASGTAAIGSGVIVNDDINASAAIVDTKLATISTAGKVSNSATTATNANTANAIVARDASGNFSAGTITATLNGNASTATQVSTSLDLSTNASRYIPFVNNLSGINQGLSLDGALVYNPGTNSLTASSFVGDLKGNADTVTNGVTTSNISSYATTAVTAGTGLSGGGTVGALTLNLDFSELTDKTSDIAGTTEFILQDGTTESRKAASEIKLSFFNNDSGWTSNTGDITSVVAGNGLTGGATSGDATLTVGAGTGITVNANDVAINTSTVPLLSSANTFTNTQQATLFSGSIGRYDSNAVSLLVPKGTYYATGGNGSVVIEIPNNTSFMARFKIKFYTYSSDKGSFDVIVGGYYAGSSWSQTSAYIVGDPNKTGLNLPVRFCENTSTSNPTIIIGEQGTSTSWSYFSVMVSEIDASGYSIDSLSTWNGDYTVSVNGALPSATYTTSSTITDCVVGGGDTVSLSANNTWTGQNTFSGYDLTVNDITVGRRNDSSNVIVGQYAGNASQTGTNNIFLGRYAASNNSSGGSNVVIGGEAGDITTGTNNVAIGYRSLNGSVTNSYNTGLGAYTLYNLTSGQYNLAMGYNAMGSGIVTGEDNIAAGRNALYSLTSARYNVGIGYYALFANQTGWSNVAIGYQAGDSITSGGTNTFLGYNAGSSVTTGQYNVILGGYNGTSALSNSIVLSDGQANVRLFADSAGNVGIGTTSPGEKLEVNGNIKFTSSGQGIDFGNTAGSGASSTILDDYEEGSWTPRVFGSTTAGTATYASNSQVGRYTRVGNKVFIQMFISVTNHTGTGDMRIDGLPYTPAGGTNVYSSLSARVNSLVLPSSSTAIQAYIQHNADLIQLHGYQQNGTINAVQVDTGFSMILEGSYMASA